MSLLPPEGIAQLVDCETDYISALVDCIEEHPSLASRGLYIDAVKELCAKFLEQGFELAGGLGAGVSQPDDALTELDPKMGAWFEGVAAGMRATAHFYETIRGEA